MKHLLNFLIGFSIIPIFFYFMFAWINLDWFFFSDVLNPYSPGAQAGRFLLFLAFALAVAIGLAFVADGMKEKEETDEKSSG